MSTDNGVARFDPKSLSVDGYSTADGARAKTPPRTMISAVSAPCFTCASCYVRDYLTGDHLGSTRLVITTNTPRSPDRRT